MAKRERGDGGLFKMKGSRFWYAQIYKEGKPYRISTRCEVKEEAKDFLKKLILDKVAGKPFVGDVQKTFYGDLRAGLIANYIEKGNRSLLTRSDGTEFINGLDALDAHFGFEADKNPGVPVTKITTDAARDFATKRLAEVSNSTVNNSLALLRRMLRIGYEDGKLPHVPVIRLLKANPSRRGFLEPKKFDELIKHLPLNLRSLITFLFWTGVRLGEALQITWDQVDLKDAMIRLHDEQTKSGEARTIPLADPVLDILKTVQDKQGPLFDATNLRKAWAKACVAAGLGTLEKLDKNGNQRYSGLIIHDLRRSAVRNLRKAGVDTTVIMKISGHKTDSIFRRYNVVDERDLRDAMKRRENLIDYSESSVKVTPRKAGRKQLTA